MTAQESARRRGRFEGWAWSCTSATFFIGLTVCNRITIVALVVSTVQSSGRIGIATEEVNQVKATG